MMRLEPGINHESARASPVLLLHERADPFDIGGRIRAGEGHPQEVGQSRRREGAVVNHNHQWEPVERMVTGKLCCELCRAAFVPGRAFYGQDARLAQSRRSKTLG